MTHPPTVPVETVHRLARRSGHPGVSSLYLDVDGAHRPVAATYVQAFEQLVRDLRHRADARHDHALRRSVEGDVERMRDWLGRGLDRTATRGVALFSCSAEGYFEAVPVPVAVRDEAAVAPTARIRQLVELVDEPEPFAVALVDRTHLRLLRVQGPDVEERPPLVFQQDRAVDVSVTRGDFQHHEEEAVRIHLRRAADEVDEIVQTWAVRRLVLGGPDDAVAELERHLRPMTVELVVGRTGVRVGAPTDEVAAVARRVAEVAERQHEVDLVEEVRQRAAGHHGAVTGIEDTLAVLEEQRVATLLVRDGFVAPGAACPACGHVGPDLRLCPVCGATNQEVEDVVEVAIERAVAQAADVEFCRNTELDRFGSIAAIERY